MAFTKFSKYLGGNIRNFVLKIFIKKDGPIYKTLKCKKDLVLNVSGIFSTRFEIII